MRAGKLDRLIEVQRSATTINDHGTPGLTWSRHKRLRAEVLKQEAGEFLSGGGETETATAIFRTRWVEDVTPGDRVLFDGRAHDIRDVVSIGQRAGLELRCVTRGRGTP